jgi:hypothetical protein
MGNGHNDTMTQHTTNLHLAGGVGEATGEHGAVGLGVGHDLVPQVVAGGKAGADAVVLRGRVSVPGRALEEAGTARDDPVRGHGGIL